MQHVEFTRTKFLGTHPIPLRFTGVPWCVSAIYFDSSIIHKINVLLSVKFLGVALCYVKPRTQV